MEHYKNLDLEDVFYFCEFDLIWKTEQWKDVVSYEGLYQVSDLGRVKSLNYARRKINKILKLSVSNNGYLRIELSYIKITKKYLVHQLVAMSFLDHKPCGHKLVINHKNFNRQNNNFKNLEIVTQRVNANKKHLKTSSKYTGVSWHKTKQKWESYIRINGKSIYLGIFINETDASNAYKTALKNIQK
jgi:hypothetical protein